MIHNKIVTPDGKMNSLPVENKSLTNSRRVKYLGKATQERHAEEVTFQRIPPLLIDGKKDEAITKAVRYCVKDLGLDQERLVLECGAFIQKAEPVTGSVSARHNVYRIKLDVTDKASAESIIRTCAHELFHIKQIRDGKNPDEQEARDYSYRILDLLT